MSQPDDVAGAPPAPRGIQIAGGRPAAGKVGLIAAGVLAAGLTGAGIVTTRRVRRARERAERLRRDLDHDALVGPRGGRPLRLVVLGDSSADGYGLTDPALALPRRLGERVAERLGRAVRIVSFAADGARTADVSEQQIPRLEVTGADMVAVVVGVNDATARRRPKHVHEDTCRLLAQVRRAAPGAQVALLACPDLGDAPALPWPLGRVVGIATRLVARTQTRAAADMGVPCVRLEGTPGGDGFGEDGFHPGADGADAMAGALADALAPTV